MNIKHLVLPGGGNCFFLFYGLIKQLHIENVWKYDTLTSIHCTSCGSIIAFIILLKINWSIIDNYIINRPWQKVYTITPEMCLDALQSKGVIDINYLYIFAEPLLKTVEWSNKITLKEVYDITKIDLYIYVTNYTTLDPYCFHYKTDPDIPLLMAIYMSSSIPILAKPLDWKGTYYIDGGLYYNNPIKPCMDLNNMDEMLTFNLKFINHINTVTLADQNVFNYMHELLIKLLIKFKADRNPDLITTYQINISVPNLWNQSWDSLLESSSVRLKSIDDSIPYIKDFIKLHQ